MLPLRPKPPRTFLRHLLLKPTTLFLTLSSPISHPQTSTPHHLLPTLSQIRNSSSSGRWKLRQSSDPYTREAKVLQLKSRAAFKLLQLDNKYNLFRRCKTVVDLGFAPGSWSQVAIERVGTNGTVVGIDILPAQPPRGVSTFQGNFLDKGVQRMVKEFLLEDQERKRQRREEEESSIEEGEEEKEDVVRERKSYIDLEREAVAGREEKEKEEKDESQDKKKKSMRVVDIVLSDMSEPWPQTYGFTIKSLSNPYFRMMNTSGIAIKDHAGSMDLCHAALSFASDTLKPGGHFVCKFYQGSEDKDFEKILKKMFQRVHREKPDSSRSESKETFFVALKRKGDVTLEDVEESAEL
ncbi:rRNA methyltransferase 2 [Podospora fimiseda]|uniref:rRNA methyltransferase 2, mitochondrial n=1 Tax=Podospora fimiseda TaxID=252190 RepID=A0AAN7BTG6_9PEZI|nr:rRNA methyltransferase 2 [Podospora fimiseda]